MLIRLFLSIALVLAVIPSALAGQAKYATPCSIGDPSLTWYLALDDAAQEAFVANYRNRFEGPVQLVRSELLKLFATQEFSTDARLKSVGSIREKILRKITGSRPYRCFSRLSDIGGGRVVVPNYATFPYVGSVIEASFKVLKVDTQLSSDPAAPYRAIHYDVVVQDRRIELQLHTRRSVLVADASHKLVYKGQYSNDDQIKSLLGKISYAAYRLDSHLAASYPRLSSGLPGPARACLEKLLNQLNAIRLKGAFTPVGDCPYITPPL